MCVLCMQNIRNDANATSRYKAFKKQKELLRTKLWTEPINPNNIDLNTVETAFKSLYDSVLQSLDWGTLANLDPTSERYRRLMAMQLNLVEFAALKDYSFLQLIMDVKSVVDNEQEFYAEFDAAHDFYYNLHLDTEIAHVNSVGYAINSWEKVMENASTMEYLTYQTAGDERVRIQHRAWDNITLRYDDKFWNTHYPPNGYRCRCQVIQDFEGELSKLTPDQLNKLPPPDKGFERNWGKGDIAFTKEHPYMQVDLKKNTELAGNITAAKIKLNINQ